MSAGPKENVERRPAVKCISGLDEYCRDMVDEELNLLMGNARMGRLRACPLLPPSRRKFPQEDRA